MKGKKNIDTFLKKRFNDFEQSPPPEVWSQIKLQLQNEKKDKKVIPFWFKIAGVAALIALLVTIGSAVFNSSNPQTPQITQEDVLNPNTDKSNGETNAVITNTKSKDQKKTNASKNNTLVVEENSAIKISEKNNLPVSKNKTYKTPSNTGISTIYIKNKENKLLKEDDLLSETKRQNNIKENNPANTTIAIANKEEKLTNKTISKDVTSDSKKNENGVTNTDENTKPSIFDAIEDKNNEEEQNKKNTQPKSWEVTPNFAPVYYSSLSNGSSLDASFKDNPQKGDITFSYGVQVSYAVSDKIKIRSGINTVDLRYATSGLDIGSGPVSSALKSIDYGGKQTVVTVADRGTFSNPANGNTSAYQDINLKSTSGNAELIQDINYLEVPLEIQYTLLNKKLGINLIGGFSTLFLSNNDVYVRDGNYKETLGKANNLSTTSFTTNVGLGINYKFTKKILFSIEPLFKYQLNTYTESSVDFKPYYIGLYSGFRFKF